jgi:purine-binding chemotaxis protein CheW
VLPIVDLGARLGLGSTEPIVRHAILVTEIGGRLVGLLVDGVSELSSDTLQPTPDVGCQVVAHDYVRGLLTHDGRLLTLLCSTACCPLSTTKPPDVDFVALLSAERTVEKVRFPARLT